MLMPLREIPMRLHSKFAEVPMILYSLKNFALQLEVFEDRLIFRPGAMLRVLGGRNWANPVTLPFCRIERIELRQRLWPMRHDLAVHTKDEVYHFRFRGPLPFYQRLAPYLERQVEKYRNHPEAFPPAVKTVLDLVEEKRQKALKEFMRAA